MWHPNFKFPESLKLSSADECSEYFEKKFVLMHDKIGCVQERLETEFFESREQQIALVIGPTGVGKSRLAHSLFETCYKHIPDEECRKNLPMIYFEADIHSKGNFSWKGFYKQLLRSIGELEEIRIYGKPVPSGEYGARKYGATNRMEDDLKSDLIDRIREYGVKYVLFDEIQHVFKYGGKSAERNLDILKSISNKSGCRFVGLGTYEVSFSVDKSAQLSRRILTLEFPAYTLNSKADFEAFKSAYSGMLAYMPIQLTKELGSYSNEVFIGCCGCVGILKEWLNRALNIALKESSPLAISHLKRTRLKGSQLKSIAEEIKEGKVFFEEPDDNEIAMMLGILGGSARPQDQDKPSKKTGNRKPGERKPTRDPVL